MTVTRIPLEERFWKKVLKAEYGCWPWLASKTIAGYGQIGPGGGGKQTNLFAHRVSYELTYGKIPEGMLVLHRCDNRACVRPDHLFLGTYSDNLSDAFQKGRLTQITKMHNMFKIHHPNAKLTKEQAEEIRRIWRYNGCKFPDGMRQTLAEKYGVNQGTIYTVTKTGHY